MISQTKPFKTKSLQFNFAVTKICAAIHLSEDGTRMAAYGFNYPLV